MLYIISTPIGNVKDTGLRAIETLEKLDLLLCEDTRNTANLLKLLGVKNQPKLISLYDEIEQQKIPEILIYLKQGLEVGLVSDAGTPLLSDPGWLLVKRCQAEGLEYTAVPGPSALINAMVLSGLPMGRFSYLGFLPKKKGDRRRVLEEYKNVGGSKVVYESPFRVVDLLEDINEVFGEDTDVRVIREMTKKFEEVVGGCVGELLTNPKIRMIKGEVVVVFANSRG